MKKYIPILLLLALIPCLVGWGPVMMSGGGSSGVNLSSDSNLQAWYNFDNNLTDTKNGNNLTAESGTPTYSNTVYKNGTHSIIVATDDKVSIATTSLNASFPGKAASSYCTVGGWIKLTNASVHNPILYITDVGAAALPITLWAEGDGHIYFRVQNSADAYKKITCNTTLSNDTWYFVVGEWDGSNVKIYIGTESTNIAEDDTSPPACASIKTITTGALQLFGGYTYYTAGNIDDLAVFNRVLSLPEKISWQNHGLNNSH